MCMTSRDGMGIRKFGGRVGMEMKSVEMGLIGVVVHRSEKNIKKQLTKPMRCCDMRFRNGPTVDWRGSR